MHDHLTDHREMPPAAQSPATDAHLPRDTAAKSAQVATYRPVLQAVARMIATDRRAVVLATEKAEVLLANSPAGRIGISGATGGEAFGSAMAAAGADWPDLCARAQRAGSVRINLTLAGAELEGELVHLPLGQAEGFLLRLSESDQEATWLRNRARAANLMRVAHDMRTPIQALLVAAERILDAVPAGPETAAESGRNMQVGEAASSPGVLRQQLRRAAGLALEQISNVLGVIRGEQSVSGLRPDEDFSLSTELRGLQAMITPIAEARGAQVVLTVSPQEDIWVHGPVRFVRALCQNMVDNSVKYGGDLIEIHVQCQDLAPMIDGIPALRPVAGDAAAGKASDESGVALNSAPNSGPNPELGGGAYAITIEVCDQGGGLPEAQKARLRAALGQAAVIAPSMVGGAQAGFAKADLEKAGKDDADRPSAGLEVLAHALRQLGGKLELHDRRAEGAEQRVTGTSLRATFTLPRGKAQSRAQSTAESMEHAPLRAPKGAPCLAGIGVLVVEDSPASRDWLVHMLSAAGAQVQAAENGIEALAILRDAEAVSRIDLMLSDMTLPFMSGVELARRIRADQASGQIAWRGALVALTAHVEPAIDAACHAAGMARVLEKPILPAQLCQEIFDVVSAARSQEGAATSAACLRAAPPSSPASRSPLSRSKDSSPPATLAAAPASDPAPAQAKQIPPAAQEDRPSGDTATHPQAPAPRRAGAALISAKTPPPAKPLAVSARGPDFAPIAAGVVGELIAQLGASGAKRFMHRACTEAHSVLKDMRREGISADTGRMLHAATGACGLTGLKRVERGLRTLETALPDRSVDLTSLLSELEHALEEAAQAIEEVKD